MPTETPAPSPTVEEAMDEFTRAVAAMARLDGAVGVGNAALAAADARTALLAAIAAEAQRRADSAAAKARADAIGECVKLADKEAADYRNSAKEWRKRSSGEQADLHAAIACDRVSNALRALLAPPTGAPEWLQDDTFFGGWVAKWNGWTLAAHPNVNDAGTWWWRIDQMPVGHCGKWVKVPTLEEAKAAAEGAVRALLGSAT